VLAKRWSRPESIIPVRSRYSNFDGFKPMVATRAESASPKKMTGRLPETDDSLGEIRIRWRSVEMRSVTAVLQNDSETGSASKRALRVLLQRSERWQQN
jgi:hypothetical protein